jgi:hypothetical protein
VLKGSAEAFAGGKLEGSAGADLGAVDVGARGSVSYGIGYKLDGEASFNNGKFKFDFDAGATFGLGADFGATIEIDVAEAASDISNGAKAVWESSAGALGDAGDKIVGGFKSIF